MRILVVGDSLAFHRPWEGQTLDQCWPWLLKTRLPGADVWVRSEPASLVERAVVEVRFFESSLALFDLVIVQCGITDSCPRPIPYWLHCALGRMWDGKPQKFINRKYRSLLRFHHKSWTSEKKFRLSLAEIVSRVTPTSRVLFLPIVKPCKHLTAKAPGVSDAVGRYNSIIREVGGHGRVLNDFHRICTEEYVLDDGHHLNASGHRLLADHIINALADDSLPLSRAA